MATIGTGYFDGRGQYFKTPAEATLSDLAAIMGQIGEWEGLASGIAKTLLDNRHAIDKIFRDHEAMLTAQGASAQAPSPSATNVSRLRDVG